MRLALRQLTADKSRPVHYKENSLELHPLKNELMMDNPRRLIIHKTH